MQAHISLMLLLAATPGLLAAPLPTTKPIIVRLESGPGAPGSVIDFYAFYAAQTVNKLKSFLGQDALPDVVKNETDQADIWWKEIIAESDPNKPANPYARVSAMVDPKVLNTTSLQAWFGGYAAQGFPSRLLQANPQHYQMKSNGTTLKFIEVTGKGPATEGIATPEQRKPFVKDLVEFPIQSISSVELRDGTHLHDTQISFRDIQDGIEIEFDFYMPEKTPEDVLEAASEHFAIEATNWIMFAYDDIVAGK